MVMLSDESSHTVHWYLRKVFTNTTNRKTWGCKITQTIRFHQDCYGLLKTPDGNLKRKEERRGVQLGELRINFLYEVWLLSCLTLSSFHNEATSVTTYLF